LKNNINIACTVLYIVAKYLIMDGIEKEKEICKNEENNNLYGYINT